MESLMVSSHSLTGERAAVQAIPTFEEIFTRYNAQIYSYLLGMVANPEQAQDLTQDTFVKAYRALPNVKELILPAWLYRIATNTALDALRHRKLIAWLPFGPDDEDRFRAPERDFSGEMAESEMVRQSLLALTPRQRACLLLRTRDGLSIDEICTAMKMSRDAVKATLYRGKERFRTAYRALEHAPQ